MIDKAEKAFLATIQQVAVNENEKEILKKFIDENETSSHNGLFFCLSENGYAIEVMSSGCGYVDDESYKTLNIPETLQSLRNHAEQQFLIQTDASHKFKWSGWKAEVFFNEHMPQLKSINPNMECTTETRQASFNTSTMYNNHQHVLGLSDIGSAFDYGI